jgi:hypothetical protein
MSGFFKIIWNLEYFAKPERLELFKIFFGTWNILQIP